MSEFSADHMRIFRQFIEAQDLAKANAAAAQQESLTDLCSHLEFIQLAGEALRGLGSMMLPGATAEDFQMNQARSTDASAVFRFFGEALRRPSNESYVATERLQWAAKESASHAPEG